jgi:aminoglycoside N3'-acetyltransferase
MKGLQDIYFDIPSNEHIMVHVRIVNFFKNFPVFKNYSLCSSYILDVIRKSEPKSIAVPTFTYSYTKNFNFSVNKSKSEVGRFSDEIRKLYPPKMRTLDPVFSIIDTENFGWVDSQWNDEAFGKKSIWESWDKFNGIILNIDLPEVTATQIHYIEKLSKVPYRSNKFFPGNVYSADNTLFKLNYAYFARNYNYHLDREKRLSIMEENKIVFNSVWNGLPVRWFRAKDMRKLLQPILQSNPNSLLK